MAITLLVLVVVPLLAWMVGQGETLPAPPPSSMEDPELGVPIGAPLLSISTGATPSMDGVVETAWEAAPPLTATLHYGLHGDERAGAIELRSLYDDERVYFLARWPAEAPDGNPDVWRNLVTVHWRLVDGGQVSGDSTGSDGLACTVGCHTATASDAGELIAIRSETIPPGLNEDMPAAGGWLEGAWLLEWSRPRDSETPYDQDLRDPERDYRFFVKLFRGLADRADPVSDVHTLRLDR
ncbi:MAG: hypothetical protein PVG11_07850 [Anaerolineae bacterium]